ncbi:COG3500 Phage protein D [uncultured Caudovirales phage]|uniref:COG3500 Phage protein D n=1 Tax=uncultured Caudovirales phage TaxID=2100421 RepID=A0A6J5KQE8_9CAUD|nr:COG3500 Phage protein D [uncultured Caudovirales phage]
MFDGDTYDTGGGKYRRGTSFDVSFPTLPSLTVRPRRADLYQKEYHHDILVLEFAQFSTSWFNNLKTGVPVVFQWSQGTAGATWIGYVSFVSKAQSGKREQIMEVHCISSGFPLKERSNRVFKSKTIPEAAKIIAEEHGFNFVGDVHPRRFDQLTMAGHSYWEWLQEQAKRIGFAVVVDGMDLIFKPIDKIFDASLSSVPSMNMFAADLPMNSLAMDRTLDTFKMKNGEHIESSVYNRAVKNAGGVDPLSGKSLRAKSSPNTVGRNTRNKVSDVLFTEHRSDQVANSYDAVAASAEGAAQMARMNVPAKVTGQGDPRMRPHRTVLINGTGEHTDGFWVINEVHHMFHKIGDYQVEMSISTDGTGKLIPDAFRRTPGGSVGTIDLTQAVISGKAVSKPTLAKLASKTPILRAGNQGYLRTPSVWKKAPSGFRRANG